MHRDHAPATLLRRVSGSTMRCLAMVFLWCASTQAVEPASWPLWDGKESVEQYANRVNLPPSQTLYLGHHVTLELVLIPAGQISIGVPEPTAPRETVRVGQSIALAGVGLA